MVCKIKVAKNCGLNVCLVNISGKQLYCVIMLLMFNINRWIILLSFISCCFGGKIRGEGIEGLTLHVFCKGVVCHSIHMWTLM